MLWPLLLGSTWLLSGCETVTIRDETWYVDQGPMGAMSFHTLVPGRETILPGEWYRMQQGMICSEPSTFGAQKATIERLCNETGMCRFAVPR